MQGRLKFQRRALELVIDLHVAGHTLTIAGVAAQTEIERERGLGRRDGETEFEDAAIALKGRGIVDHETGIEAVRIAVEDVLIRRTDAGLDGHAHLSAQIESGAKRLHVDRVDVVLVGIAVVEVGRVATDTRPGVADIRIKGIGFGDVPDVAGTDRRAEVGGFCLVVGRVFIASACSPDSCSQPAAMPRP